MIGTVRGILRDWEFIIDVNFPVISLVMIHDIWTAIYD